MSRKLRLLYVAVQPVVVWDDGDTLAPGPALQAGNVTLDGLRAMVEQLPAQIAELEQQMAGPRASHEQRCGE